MDSFFKTTLNVPRQRYFSKLLTTKIPFHPMGSTLMVMLALLTLPSVAEAKNKGNLGFKPAMLQPTISILPIVEDNGDSGSDPEIPDLDVGILPIDEWKRFPGWWMPRNLYFSFDPETKAIETFTDAPQIFGSEVAQGNHGLYYGVDSWGGDEGYGSIYSLNPVNNHREELVNFSSFRDQSDFFSGSFPYNLTLGDDGSFYGTTYYGGEDNGGSIFKFNPDGNTLEETIASFASVHQEVYEDGEYSYSYSYSGLPSALTLGQGGIFYGTTSYGGDKQGGSIFAFDPSSNQLSTVFNFEPLYEEGIDYAYTYSISPSVLTLAGDGLLYGTTFYGGDYNKGSIFSFDPNLGELAIVANFEPLFDVNGYEYFPSPSSLTLGKDGILYGTTSGGVEGDFGTIFAFDPTSKSLSTVADFGFLAHEKDFWFLPSPSTLTAGSDGLLYGTVYNDFMYYFVREDKIDNNLTATPEPLTLLGAITAINLGVFFKKRGKKTVK